MSMQVSIQTDRKPSQPPPQQRYFVPVDIALQQTPSASLPIQEESQKQKQRKLKKLTLINKELIQTLKKQNDELTRKINKQKNLGTYRQKQSKSVNHGSSDVQSPSSSKTNQKTKKQLENAYKQIQMYKHILQGIKAKEISTQSLQKLTQLENRIKMEDATIEKLQRQLKYVKGIKDQQQKQLNLFQNQDVKGSVLQLEEEVKKLKEKLKKQKIDAKKREIAGRRQHQFYMELQKALRKHNDQYYPGKIINNKKQEKKPELHQDISEKEWQLLRSQLSQLKFNHQETNKKIELLARQRNRQLRSAEENELRLKQKLKKLAAVKSKITELSKLVLKEETHQKISEKEEDQDDGQEQQNRKYEVTMKNGKKVYKPKNPEHERQVKKWMIPQGYCMEKGKIMPDSVFYSDKTVLKSVKKSKIIGARVWIDGSCVPSIIQFRYSSQTGKQFDGIQPYPPQSLSHLTQKTISYSEGDYLSKLKGKFVDGSIVSLTFISKYNKRQTFNEFAQGEEFRFEPRPNQIPGCFFGAVVIKEDEKIRICYLGCEFMADW